MQGLVPEVEVEVGHLHEESTVAATSRGFFTSFEGKLADTRVEGRHDLEALQTRADAKQDTLSPAVRDRTCL